MNVDRAWTGAFVRRGAAQFSETPAGEPRGSPPWTLKTALGQSALLISEGAFASPQLTSGEAQG